MKTYTISLTVSVSPGLTYVGCSVKDPIGETKVTLSTDQLHTRLQELMNNRLLILAKQLDRELKGKP